MTIGFIEERMRIRTRTGGRLRQVLKREYVFMISLRFPRFV